MLFFPNAELFVASLSLEKNSEGTRLKRFDFENPLETFRADVQPNTLNPAQIELYGLNARTANSKKCFVNSGDGNSMSPDNRVKVVYDSGSTEYYSIQPVNSWGTHKEFLLIPVENETQ